MMSLKQQKNLQGGAQFIVRPEVLRASYQSALPQLSTANLQGFALRQDALKNCQLSYQPQLEADAKALGINLEALATELKQISALTDPKLQEMQLDAFAKKNASALGSLYTKFAGSSAYKGFTSKLALSKKQRVRSGQTGGISIEENPSSAAPSGNAELRLTAPFSFSGGETGKDSGGLSVHNLALIAGSSQKLAFIGQTLLVPAGVREMEVVAILSRYDARAYALATGGYSSAEALLTLRLLTASNQLLTEDRRSMVHMMAVVVGSGDKVFRAPVSLLARYVRPNPGVEERFHLNLTAECWTGGGGIAGATCYSSGTLERFDVRLIR